MKKILLSLTFLALVMIAGAQSPEKISYQAVIRNSANTLLANTNVGVQVSILQGSATGTSVYVERHTAATNANGLVSISIGTGTPVTGMFGTINWGSGTYFVKTETDPAGGINYSITGTSQLMSVPYALFAKNVQNNDDADASPTNEFQALSINGNQLSISDGNTVTLPSGGAGGDNWGTQVAMADATLGGNGLGATPLKIAQQGAVNGQILKWNGTTWLPADDQGSSGSNPTGPAGGDLSGTYPNPSIGDGKVTTAKIASSAVTDLKLADNSVTSLKITDGAVNTSKVANNAITVAKLPSGATPTTYLRGDGTWATPPSGSVPEGNDGNIQFKQGEALAGSDNLFWNNSINRLGIGTSTPDAPLAIVHDGTAPRKGLLVKSTYSFSAIYADAANGDAAIVFLKNGELKWNTRNNPENNDNYQIYEITGPGVGQERMRIERSTGKVVIHDALEVRNGKGIIRSIDNIQRKTLSTTVTVNTAINAGSTAQISFTFPESFTAVPVVYVANATGGGFAEVVMSIAAVTTTGGKLFVYNPKSTSQTPNFTVNIVALGQE